MKQYDRSIQGQALVTLLFFMIIAVTITSAAIVMILVNTQSAGYLESGQYAYGIAESGIENALLRFLRNPSYCGETLPVGKGSAVIAVTDANHGCNGVSPITITSTGTISTFSRTIQAVVQFTNNQMTVTSWKEIYP